MKLKLKNGILLTPYRKQYNQIILIDEGQISYLGPDLKTEDYKEIDCQGYYISPGFIDMHLHGGGGYDFMDAVPEAFVGAAKCHAEHGTTSILCTCTAANNEHLGKVFEAFRQAKKINSSGSNLLGLHLEGPYYSLENHGAIETQYLRDPSPDDYKEILSMTDDLKVWSEAPERPGSMEFGRYLEKNGILAAIGHSTATFEQVLEARENGFHHITHLYSCTSSVIRKNCFRIAGIVEAAYYCDDITVEMISDGVHLPESLLRLICKLKGPDRIAPVSDCMRAAGMEDGDSILGCKENGLKVIVKDHIAWLPDGSGFAGGTGTSDLLLHNLVHLAGLSVEDAVKSMSATPARILKLNRKGILQQGYDADLTVFNSDLQIEMTIVNGQILYHRN